jgi:cbb3-type cytochrome oxidase maturation protein
VSVTIALFVAGISMGIGAAFVWAWAVRSGQLRDLEKSKEQIFWPDLAGEDDPRGAARGPSEGTR